MKKYDDVIVGGGSSGLALSLLLAMNGRKILLVEKGGGLGGGLTRFRKNGVPFDSGFHFTGGFAKGGILYDMLTVLGIRERIHPNFLYDGAANKYVFEQNYTTYEMPSGVDVFIERLQRYFPAEKDAIAKYFAMAKSVYDKTSSLNLLDIAKPMESLDEDYISLAHVMDDLFCDQHLKGILSTYCMCYGVKPSEVSFANHCRVSYGLYEAVARVDGGGDAFISAYTGKLQELGVEVRLNATVAECCDVRESNVRRITLNTGEEVSFENCVFTIHPKEVLNILPKEYLKKAFVERVEAFESSNGFFTLHGVVDESDESTPFTPSITSIFPSSNLDDLLDETSSAPTAMVIMKSIEQVGDTRYNVMNVLEPDFVSRMDRWKHSSVGKRSKDYYEYKESRKAHMLERLAQFEPSYRDSFKVYDAATLLTYRDYLHSYDGSAYGIKQKIAQFNLFGKLPLRNMYVAGQSAVLPGIVGAMMSSFIIARTLIGKDEYEKFIQRRLCA